MLMTDKKGIPIGSAIFLPLALHNGTWGYEKKSGLLFPLKNSHCGKTLLFVQKLQFWKFNTLYIFSSKIDQILKIELGFELGYV